MGVLLIVIGLAAAGTVADYVVENNLTSAPGEPFTLFGGTFTFSRPEVVLAAFVLGVLAMLFVVLGIGLLRGSWGRRRALKRRIADLERENTNLLTQGRLAEVARSDRDGRTDAAAGSQAQAQ